MPICWRAPRSLILATALAFILSIAVLFGNLSPSHKHAPRVEAEIAEVASSSDVAIDETQTRHGTAGKINACILVLVRNEDADALATTMDKLEGQFNAAHLYPYVLLNNIAFSDEFKRTVRAHTNATIEFGLIPVEHWSVPAWIDDAKLNSTLNYFASLGINTKGQFLPYHHMIRYYAGFFFKHPLTLKYDYYMRIDDRLDFPCSFPLDPFRVLADAGKSYGFIIAYEDDWVTMPTLWETEMRWLRSNGRGARLIDDAYAVKYLLMGRGDHRSIRPCSFWTNFEVAAFSLFRNKEYESFFAHLDKAGGFYYERWGDAPVHTHWALFALNKSQIHRFDTLAYAHDGVYQWQRDPNIACKLTDEKLIQSRASQTYAHDCVRTWDEMFPSQQK